METITTMDKDDVNKKIPGSGRGTGRRRGSKNLVKAAVKRDIAEFFKGLTIESMAWRKNVRRHLEQVHDAVEFRYWSRIAIEYGFGTPIKMQPATTERRSLNFITARGLPWQNDPLAVKERELLAAQARDDARDAEQKALEAAAPDEEGGEALELVRETGR